jgi:hypothetical protein
MREEKTLTFSRSCCTHWFCVNVRATHRGMLSSQTALRASSGSEIKPASRLPTLSGDSDGSPGIFPFFRLPADLNCFAHRRMILREGFRHKSFWISLNTLTRRYLWVHAASQPSRSTSISSQPWENQTSLVTERPVVSAIHDTHATFSWSDTELASAISQMLLNLAHAQIHYARGTRRSINETFRVSPSCGKNRTLPAFSDFHNNFFNVVILSLTLFVWLLKPHNYLIILACFLYS